MSWRDETATVATLWRRDMLRFFREKSRIAGAVVQPLLFWLVIGQGMNPAFQLPSSQRVSYLEYFFPGVLLMVILFSTLFTTMSVIDDRHNGFLQGVLVGPGSRGAVVLGKSLGSSTVAFVQGAMLLLLAPLAGYSWGHIQWPTLLLVLSLTSVGLASLGFAIAWWLDSVQGYHVVMMLLLMPAWVLSGAIFPPPQSGGWLQALYRVNPLTYAMEGTRHAMYVHAPFDGISSPLVSMLVLIVFAIASVSTASYLCHRRR
jgi:daunorubicin resistance ABC transporter membrane protein